MITEFGNEAMEKRIRVADEVWIAVATLHRSHPDRADFTLREIVEQAESTNLTGVRPLRPGVKIHAYLHCVANQPPSPGPVPDALRDGARAAGKDSPRRQEMPLGHLDLIDWNLAEYAGGAAGEAEDPVLSLRGLGREIWADEDTDAYVRRQRAGWR